MTRQRAKVYESDKVSRSGPYSHGLELGGLVYVSGQTALNGIDSPPKGHIKDQTRLSIQNLSHILDQAGLTLDHVIKVNVYLKDMNDFDQMNKVYMDYFKEPYPVRTCVAVKDLPLGADIEIEVIAQR